MSSNSFNKGSQLLDRPKVCKAPCPPPIPIPIEGQICYDNLPTFAENIQAGGVDWIDPANWKLKDGNEAEAYGVKDESTDWAVGYRFLFDWPAGYAVVDGVTVSCKVRTEREETAKFNYAFLSLSAGITQIAGSDLKLDETLLTNASQIITWGADNDDWNAGLNVLDVENNSFCIVIYFINDERDNTDIFLDWMECRVCASKP